METLRQKYDRLSRVGVSDEERWEGGLRRIVIDVDNKNLKGLFNAPVSIKKYREQWYRSAEGPAGCWRPLGDAYMMAWFHPLYPFTFSNWYCANDKTRDRMNCLNGPWYVDLNMDWFPKKIIKEIEVVIKVPGLLSKTVMPYEDESWVAKAQQFGEGIIKDLGPDVDLIPAKAYCDDWGSILYHGYRE